MQNKEKFAEGISFKKVFWIFIIGCIFGCIMEMLLHFFKYSEWVSRQGLIYGPLNPVYGLGAAAFTIFLGKQKNIFIIFIISALLGGSFEYICSLVQEHVFGTISWDYSNQPFNINGRTSLKYMIYWGLLGVLFIKLIYPFLSKWIEKIPIKTGNIITIIMLIFIIIDCAISIMAGCRQDQRQKGNEANTYIEVFLDTHYPDSRLDKIFENKKSA